jgi:hypothetical protein
MDTNKEMSKTDEIEKRPEFVAYNQAVEDAKEAIRGEHVDDPNAASTFINAIARKCSPHVYVNRLDAGGERCAECGRLRKHVADLEHDLNECVRQCNEVHGS